jgi:hypothetical protein
LRITPIILTALIGTAAASGTANADGASVADGQFETLTGGIDLGYTVEGVARIVRTSGDQTLVTVHVSGLDPNSTYPTHVHDQPCSALPPGGGHYQHEVGGAVDPDNEIWPTVHTGPTGNGLGTARHSHRARADAQAVVIHYPPDTSIRLACADLD